MVNKKFYRKTSVIMFSCTLHFMPEHEAIQSIMLRAMTLLPEKDNPLFSLLPRVSSVHRLYPWAVAHLHAIPSHSCNIRVLCTMHPDHRMGSHQSDVVNQHPDR